MKITFYKQVCGTCSKIHFSQHQRSSKCLICWKTEQDYKLGKADQQLQVMQLQYTKLHNASDNGERNPRDQEIIEHYEKLVKELNMETIWLKRQVESLREQIIDVRSDGRKKSIPQQLLYKLIALCHPDRHDNSEESTEVTKQLLAMRKPRK